MKSLLRQLLLIIILVTAVSACTTSGTEGTVTIEPTTPAPVPTGETAVPPTDDHNLANSEWILESFGPADAAMPVIGETAVTLTFAPDGQAGGSGGCNTYGTDYQVQGSTLVFGEIVSTLIACTEEGVTEQEQRYLEALRLAGEFEQRGDKLTIHYEGQGILNFIAADAATKTPPPLEGANNLVGTQWRLETFGPTAAEMPVIEGSLITLEFETAVLVTGSGGCNSYGGDYTVQDDTISFGQIVSTKMACMEQNVTDQEQRYFEALQTAESFSQTADRLTIFYHDRQSTLNFVPIATSSDSTSLEDPDRIAFDQAAASEE